MVRQLGLRNITSGNTGWENNVFVEAALPLPKHTRDLLNAALVETFACRCGRTASDPN